YGLAEHVLAATFPPRHRAPRVEDAFVSCGSPLPGHMLRIVDEEGRPAADGQIGEIALAGPSVMLGYYNDAELTRQTIRDGWLYTGDLGYLSNGELFVCGRVKDVIIVNGRKFHPQDLEWAVDDLAGVRRGRVVAFGTMQRGGPDRYRGRARSMRGRREVTPDPDVRVEQLSRTDQASRRRRRGAPRPRRLRHRNDRIAHGQRHLRAARSARARLRRMVRQAPRHHLQYRLSGEPVADRRLVRCG